MDFQTLGVLLYRTREKKHLSLLDVCSGICSQSTLSRVEQGSRELDSLTSEMLLGRIGREVTRFELILHAADYYLNQLRIEINENIEEKNYIKAKEKINLYRQHMPAEGKVHEQFCCYMECRILIAQNEITEKLSALLLRAIRYTIPDYLLENCVSRRLHSPVEIELIRMHITYNDRKCECNEVELFLIMDFVTEFYSLKQQEKIEIPLLVDCVKYEIALEKYNRALASIERALDIISVGRSMQYVGELHFLKAQVLSCVQNSIDKNREWQDECKRECFMAYASLRIRGAILDQIRKMDWIPRSLRQKQKKIDAAMAKIEADSGKVATDDELALELGISMDELSDWQGQMKSSNLISLDEYTEAGSEVKMESVGNSHFEEPEDVVEKEELKKKLVQAIDLLTEKERSVIVLYYYEDMTLKEISMTLDVSESRVSQLHTKALSKMKKIMGDYMFPA